MVPFVLLILLVTAVPAAAQSFEVASVRANGTPGAPPLIVVDPGGRVVAPNSTLRQLIRAAYGLDENRILGGPEWIAQERFALEAKAENPAATDVQLQTMLRSLLTERFKLIVRRDTRELPVYVLTVARSDGRLGPRLRPAAAECAPVRPPAGVPPPPPPPPAAADAQRRPLAPANVGLRCPVMFFPGWIAGRAMTMEQLAPRLASLVGRPVLEQTGLRDAFDFDLLYTPELPPTLNGATLPPTTDGASIFTALREDLGLALDPQRAPLEVLVVESAARPAEN